MSQNISILNHLLSSLRPGEAQVKENLAIVPLFSDVNHSLPYLTLNEALEGKLLTVQEIGSGGSVPELEAISTSDLPILLLEGEELVGAKQNRVLNTTILLKEHSRTVIPVSCTERGRWHPIHRDLGMKGSPFIHSPEMRMHKMESVTLNLMDRSSFESDQNMVWHIAHMVAREANVQTQTGAVSDVIKEKWADLKDYTEAFSSQEGQRGLAGFINGELVGLDWISYPPAFQKVFPKLLLSYATEAYLMQGVKPKEEKSAGDHWVVIKEHLLSQQWNADTACEYPSVGYGLDLRLVGSQVVGSALVYDSTVVHCVLFRVPVRTGEEPGSFYSGRYRFRDLMW